MFDKSMSNVALIRKNKPDWQAGLLNGIGGKVEYGESSKSAMVREFKEEAGMNTSETIWINFCSMSGINNDNSRFGIEFFFCIGDPNKLNSMELEQIKVFPAADIAAGKEKTIGNLQWLIALALDFGKGTYPPSKVNAFYFTDKKL